jgi:hypothetical protein
MREQISPSTATMLNVLKDKLLLMNDHLIVIRDFIIEEIIETPKKSFFNRNPQSQIVLYLTRLNIQGYNSDGRFWGSHNDDDALHMIVWFDMYRFRNNWELIIESLEKTGFEITIKGKTPKE